MRTLPAFLAAVVLSCASALGEPPSNATLIAALPPATEAVRLARFDPLLEEGAFLKPLMEFELHELVYESDRFGDEDPLARVRGLIAASSPTIRCMGLSEFGPPPTGGIGVGKVKRREIWAIEDTKLARDRLTFIAGHEDRVIPIRLEGRPAYEIGPAGKREEPRFACVLTEGFYVEAPDADELAFIIRSLAGTQDAVPERWRSVAADVDLDAPFLLLRSFPDDKPGDVFSPANPRWGERAVGPSTIAYALPDPAKREYAVACQTDQPEKFRGFLSELVRPEFRAIEDDPRGFTATLVFPEPPEYPATVDGMTIMLMLGWYIAI